MPLCRKTLLYVLLSLARGSSEVEIVTQTWVWGDDIPSSDTEEQLLPLELQYPYHGFIQLSSDSRFLSIDLVKRPTADFFRQDVPFCVKVLPAAIQLFFTNNDMLIDLVEVVTVSLETNFYTAACKCYLRTLVSFGFNHIQYDGFSQEALLKQSDIEYFCATHRVYELIAKPAHPRGGRFPTISQDQLSALATFSYTRLNYA